MGRLVLLAGALVSTVLLTANFVPPDGASSDPWLCRSDAGAFNIRNYGWPVHGYTTFTIEEDGGDRIGLILWEALAADAAVCAAPVAAAVLWLRWRARGRPQA